MKFVFTTIARLLGLSALTVSLPALATTVQFQTSMGDFEVVLYDQGTPATVANFLAYVEAGDYTDTIIHRSVDSFVIQGGGYVFAESGAPDAIDTRDPVVNEPVYSNVRGTIAMAKVSGLLNSATSQWFINLSNNSFSLDPYNRGGFTVFGEVAEGGMSIIDSIAAVDVFDMGTGFDEIPLVDYTEEDYNNQIDPTADNAVTVYSIVVTDADPDSAADLDPVPNNLYEEPTPTPTPTPSSGDGGGGGFPYALLLLLGGLSLVARKGSHNS